MAATAASSTTLTMKLLIDPRPQCRRVLFAEAGKDVVDFLFSLLALPLGTSVKLLGKDAMVGCVGNLYASVERLDDTYVVQPGAGAKDAILCPIVLSPATARTNSSLFRLPSPPAVEQQPAPKRFFVCSNYRYTSSCIRVSDESGTKCPNCGDQMTTESPYVAGAGKKAQDAASSAGSGANGFVQGIVTYTVMDDLTISPMSVISSITQLNALTARSRPRSLGALQEKTVQVGYKEGLEILKASLQSKTVLTDVFLGKKAALLNNGGTRYDALTWRA